MGLAVLALAGAAAASTTLYDQNNNDFGSGISSFVPYGTQLADDFVVPATTNWNITAVSTTGSDFGDLTSVTVTIYRDSSGSPGTAVYTDTTTTFTDAPGANSYPGGDLTIPIAVTLGPGHYWLSVQGNNTNGDNDYWELRSVVSNAAAMWQNPGGVSVTCPSWTDVATCFSGIFGVSPGTLDLMFSLTGTSTPVYAGTPGQHNCVGKTLAALSNQYNGNLLAAAQALGFNSSKALNQNIAHYCSG